MSTVDTSSPTSTRAAQRPRVSARLSDELEGWLRGDGEKTLGGLIDVFEKRAFAVVFVVLMGVPALPLPTGGATHVFEVIVVLLALQLVAGRDEIWLLHHGAPQNHPSPRARLPPAAGIPVRPPAE